MVGMIEAFLRENPSRQTTAEEHRALDAKPDQPDSARGAHAARSPLARERKRRAAGWAGGGRVGCAAARAQGVKGGRAGSGRAARPTGNAAGGEAEAQPAS